MVAKMFRYCDFPDFAQLMAGLDIFLHDHFRTFLTMETPSIPRLIWLSARKVGEL